MQPYSPNFLSNQAQRTKSTRRFLYNQVNFGVAPIALDLGCGTGVITPELITKTSHAIAIGIDIDSILLTTAIKEKSHSAVHYVIADATALPFRSSLFTFVLDHFTLMWINNSQQALAETYRILHSGGGFASIEPDYAGRIEAQRTRKDTTTSPLPIIKYLLRLGANPYTGSNLPIDLDRCGFKEIRFGVLAFEYERLAAENEIRGEADLLKTQKISWTKPFFTFTPIFWALAVKP
jgi:ubiquinone/menaquinone biosynthesis C-methylase UbiE